MEGIWASLTFGFWRGRKLRQVESALSSSLLSLGVAFASQLIIAEADSTSGPSDLAGHLLRVREGTEDRQRDAWRQVGPNIDPKVV